MLQSLTEEYRNLRGFATGLWSPSGSHLRSESLLHSMLCGLVLAEVIKIVVRMAGLDWDAMF